MTTRSSVFWGGSQSDDDACGHVAAWPDGARSQPASCDIEGSGAAGGLATVFVGMAVGGNADPYTLQVLEEAVAAMSATVDANPTGMEIVTWTLAPS